MDDEETLTISLVSMQLKEIRKIYQGQLKELYPQGEIDSFFYLTIEHFLGLERFVLAVQPGLVISKEEEQVLFETLTRLEQHEPIQYILGISEFYGLRIEVDRSVLIPRPETEELVRWILEDFPGNKKINVLDIGTGSGCIAIALAKNLADARVGAIDISGDAINLAKKNAKANETAVEFMNEDIAQFDSMGHQLDIIVSNPPYIRKSEKKMMKQNVLEFEPHTALFVSDEDPLIFYRHILKFAQNNLKDGGLIYLELNQYLAEDTQRLLDEKIFSEIELRKDLYGKDRLLRARKKVELMSD